MIHYIDSSQNTASAQLSLALKDCMSVHGSAWSELVFLCIGSDRMTGDCLGPFVGHFLDRKREKDFFIYGTLSSPVHALNLSDTVEQIRFFHPHALTVAVDASLGTKKHLGYVAVEHGALYPGAGLQKLLPPVGDISVTGVVNLMGIPEQLTLQTTRLSTVISMAEVIAGGILGALS